VAKPAAPPAKKPIVASKPLVTAKSAAALPPKKFVAIPKAVSAVPPPKKAVAVPKGVPKATAAKRTAKAGVIPKIVTKTRIATTQNAAKAGAVPPKSIAKAGVAAPKNAASNKLTASPASRKTSVKAPATGGPSCAFKGKRGWIYRRTIPSCIDFNKLEHESWSEHSLKYPSPSPLAKASSGVSSPTPNKVDDRESVELLDSSSFANWLCLRFNYSIPTANLRLHPVSSDNSLDTNTKKKVTISRNSIAHGKNGYIHAVESHELGDHHGELLAKTFKHGGKYADEEINNLGRVGQLVAAGEDQNKGKWAVMKKVDGEHLKDTATMAAARKQGQHAVDQVTQKADKLVADATMYHAKEHGMLHTYVSYPGILFAAL
jgi:hypothetical protein